MSISPGVQAVGFTLLMALGGLAEIPLGPVPFILTDLFVFIAALWLAPKYFLMSVGLFLLLGAFGVPVFAGGVGGFDHLIGPTSGYLFGYLFGGLLAHYLQTRSRMLIVRLVFVWVGYYLLFLLGIMGLCFIDSMTVSDALNGGFIPFLFSMHLKGALAFFIVEGVRKYREVQKLTPDADS